MNEFEKLEEAKYHLSEMVNKQEDRKEFEYSLSAFLASSRSVMDYARKEAPRKGKSNWYDRYMNSSLLFKFFKTERDRSIHDEPVKPPVHHFLGVSENLNVSDSIDITIKQKNGTFSKHSTQERPSEELGKEESQVNHSFKYKFDDWDGEEDVLALCESYLDELQNLIEDGIRKGFISG